MLQLSKGAPITLQWAQANLGVDQAWFDQRWYFVDQNGASVSMQVKDLFGLTTGPLPGDFLGKWAEYGRHLHTINPTAVTRATPKRRISEPVKKLGPYIASTCHWMPSDAAVTECPQSNIASGAEVIIRFISA